MKKIKVYAISRCPLGAPPEEFTKNLCTYVCKKKQIQEYIINRLVADNYTHYTKWLELHGAVDSLQTRLEYLSILFEDKQNLGSEFTIKEEYYTAEGLAALLRLSNGCTPIGSSFDTKAEIDYYLSYAKEILKTVNKETA